MANPVLETITTQTDTISGSANFNVSFPSGLTAGDELCIFLGFWNATSLGVFTVPSGWTSQFNGGNPGIAFDTTRAYAILTKTASAGDVSAGSVNIAMTSGAGTIATTATCCRVSGAVPASNTITADHENDGSAATTFTYANISVAPPTAESLLLIGYFAYDDATKTSSTYSTTPSTTLTEQTDFDVNFGSIYVHQAVVSADVDGTTAIEDPVVVYNNEVGQAACVAVLYSTPQNATANVSRLTVTPELRSLTGSNSATANVSRLDVTPEFRSVTAKSTSDRTRWNNPTKENTDWNNPTL